MNRVLGVLSVLSFLSSCGGSLLGSDFDNERALLARAAGFVKIGAFGLEFPARVTRIEEGHDSIRFMRGATPQEYGGFDGYDLKVVFTTHAGSEGVLVLRSKERRIDDSPAHPPR